MLYHLVIHHSSLSLYTYTYTYAYAYTYAYNRLCICCSVLSQEDDVQVTLAHTLSLSLCFSWASLIGWCCMTSIHSVIFLGNCARSWGNSWFDAWTIFYMMICIPEVSQINSWVKKYPSTYQLPEGSIVNMTYPCWGSSHILWRKREIQKGLLIDFWWFQVFSSWSFGQKLWPPKRCV